MLTFYRSLSSYVMLRIGWLFYLTAPKFQHYNNYHRVTFEFLFEFIENIILRQIFFLKKNQDFFFYHMKLNNFKLKYCIHHRRECYLYDAIYTRYKRHVFKIVHPVYPRRVYTHIRIIYEQSTLYTRITYYYYEYIPNNNKIYYIEWRLEQRKATAIYNTIQVGRCNKK